MPRFTASAAASRLDGTFGRGSAAVNARVPFDAEDAPFGCFRAAIRRFDEENARDPNRICIEGAAIPYELAYAGWLTTWVLRLRPDASDPLLLAARSQHLCRWMIPRSSYERTREGYLSWREDLKKFHAATSAEILREVGYPEEVVTRVNALNLKQNWSTDPECQTLEDALCLVTLERQLEELIEKTDEVKMVGIVQKTWRKMSQAAREEALQLTVSSRAIELYRFAGIVT